MINNADKVIIVLFILLVFNILTKHLNIVRAVVNTSI